MDFDTVEPAHGGLPSGLIPSETLLELHSFLPALKGVELTKEIPPCTFPRQFIVKLINFSKINQ